jgi:transcriptional regulator with PAS, ATPase and Fis domain
MSFGEFSRPSPGEAGMEKRNRDFLLHEMQHRVRQAEDSLARLLNHLPGMAYRCRVLPGFDYVLEFVSKGCESLLRMTPEAMLETRSNVIEQMMGAEDLAYVRKTIQDSLLVREPYEMYYRVTVPATGETRWIWDQGEGVFDGAGECRSIEGIMMDVTEQKNREHILQEENRQLRSSIKNSYGLGGIVGKSEAMQHCYRLLLRAAKSDINVVLYGETGVGKDLAARTIHDLSEVKGRFVPINCAAIPGELLESEFFGHVKGAFSGAVSNHAGYLAAAWKGTLFLDEVGELPLKLQSKLLRALESKTYTPVGSSEVRQADFRLLSATNRNLLDLVREREMRQDFYYRIHVLSIHIPPLRDRQGDIALLTDAWARERNIGEPLPPSVRLALEQYSWPGNVRELQNVLDRYWALGEMGPEFTLPPSPGEKPAEIRRETPGIPATGPPCPLGRARAEEEKRRILAALEQCAGKKGKSAEILGVTMRTLQRKLKKYAIA